jgi:hypothetical protein
MNAIICVELLEERQHQVQPSGLAQYSSECREQRDRRSKPTYAWRTEHDAYLRAHYFGGLNRRFQVLNQMIRLTGMPRWYIKRQAARLGLTLHMDRRPWTASEMNLLEKLVGRVSSATIAKRLHRPESSVVNKLKLCVEPHNFSCVVFVIMWRSARESRLELANRARDIT